MAQPQLFPPPKGTHLSCPDCNDQFLSLDLQRTVPYNGSLTDAEAEKDISDSLAATAEIRTKLQEVLLSHGDLILSRWSKRSVAKREATLRSTMLFEKVPNTPAPGDVWSQSKGYTSTGARWLNLSTFSEDRMRFLSLLRVRTAFASEEFAALDLREATIGWTVADPWSQRWYNVHCVKMCGEGYGTLVDWDEDLAHSWAIVGFPRAFGTINIQMSIMHFLLEMVAMIIKDAEPSGNAKWSAAVNDGFRGFGRDALWSAYTNPAFVDPVHFDPDVLYQTARARLDLVSDEVEFLQTDPEYMKFAVTLVKKSILGGEKEASFERLDLWSKIANNFAIGVWSRLDAWNIVLTRCKSLCEVYAQHSAAIPRGERLPAETLAAISKLKTSLLARLLGQSRALKMLLPNFAAFRDRFKFVGDGSSIQRESSKMDPRLRRDRLLKQVKDTLHQTDHRPYLYGLAFNFDLLERELFLQDKKLKWKEDTAVEVDDRLLDHLSELATMDEMFRACVWNQLGHNDDMGRPMSEEQVRAHDRDFPQPPKVSHKFWEKAGEDLRQFCEAPVPRAPMGLAYLQKMQESRKRLAAFWQSCRDINEESGRLGNLAHGISAESLMSFDLTPGYQELQERERLECEEAQKASDTPRPAKIQQPDHQVFVPMQTVWGDESSVEPQTLPIRHKQTKAKAIRTRQVSSDEEVIQPITSSSEDEEAEKKTDNSPILVSRVSMDIFSQMYQITGSKTGGVHWTHLVKAMNDAGLTATECGGSAVSFSNGAGSVVLHRPHPDPVVGPITLKNMGKRLKKWFHWHWERFQLREEGEAR